MVVLRMLNSRLTIVGTPQISHVVTTRTGCRDLTFVMTSTFYVDISVCLLLPMSMNEHVRVSSSTNKEKNVFLYFSSIYQTSKANATIVLRVISITIIIKRKKLKIWTVLQTYAFAIPETNELVLEWSSTSYFI